jgi:c-di-GMP-related signal transduction protein
LRAAFWDKRGRRVFSKKIRGEDFFQIKKGGEVFFSEKIRGAKAFSQKKIRGAKTFSGKFFPKPGLGTRY